MTRPDAPNILIVPSIKLSVRTTLWCAAMVFLWPASFAATLQPGATNDVTLRQFLQLVIERNESLLARVIELEIAQKKLKGERGIFEPELVFSYDRVENKRENTAEQQRSSGVREFQEKNNVYSAGLDALIPTGARIRLGYSLRDLHNNLQEPPLGVIVTNTPRAEFQTFAGLSLTQPVLKNAWFTATMANLRLATLASDAAFQEYRRQMMLLISTAEAAYWNLYLAQEQVRFFRESVALAQVLVRDGEARVQAGKGSDLEVLEAKAGLALRKSKLSEADQKYVETAAQMWTLVSQTAAQEPKPVFRAVDPPGEWKAPPQFVESGQTALSLNPDYLGQHNRLKQENVRVAYAQNQLLPQLDLKASYGLNGLGPDIGSSWDDVQNRGFPSFSAGVELHIPLGGGIKARNELGAAKLRKGQVLITVKETETQILNTIESTLRKIHNSHNAIENYGEIVTFNRNLLDTEMDRLKLGKVGAGRVLEVEVSLFEARNSVVEAQVQYERAWLELELVQGTILRSRNLDLPRADVEERMQTLFRHAGLTEEQYRGLLSDLKLSYQERTAASLRPNLGEEDYQKALRQLRQTIEDLDKTKPHE